MKRYILIVFLFASCAGYWSLGQELPPVQNFTPLDYRAGNQNWAIAQSQNKIIYVANNEGLLTFNGASWKQYPSPNGSIMRSVLVSKEMIYTGCYMEFGFWQKNEFGVLVYTSLSEQLQIKLLEDEEFWTIKEIEGFIIFQSLSRIYIYDASNNYLEVIESAEEIIKMYTVGGKIYFQRKGKGIYEIENGKDVLFLDNPLVFDTEVINIFSRQDELLLLTKNRGFYSYREGALSEVDDSLNSSIQGMSIYSAIQLRNGDFALGTISHGMIYFSIEEGILYSLSQGNAILNNTVLALFEDVDENIWMGLDNGLSYMNTNAPIEIFRDRSGALGSVYSSAIVQKTLYIGTNQGLFYKPLNANTDFKLIAGTQGQVWKLKVINDELFCGHHGGTFLVKGDEVSRISTVPGTWDIEDVSNKKNLLIQGNYDGLYLLEKLNNEWRVKNKIKGFNYSARSFELMGQEIFVNHEYRGLFRLKVDNSFSEVVSSEVDTLLRGANSGVTMYQDQVLYASSKGIFKFSEKSNKFEAIDALSELYSEEEYTSGQIVSIQGGMKFWIFTRNNMTLVSAVNHIDQPKVEKIPLALDIRRDVTDYENITAIDGKNIYLLGTTYGYMMLDIGKIEVKDFEVHFADIKVQPNDESGLLDLRIDEKKNNELRNKENNLVVDLFSPEYYNYLQPSYQYKLRGIYNEWSEWSSNSQLKFTNLPPGEYELNVRSRIGNKVSENIAAMEFSIAPPWLFSGYMLSAYLIAMIIISIVVHNLYRRYYHRQRQKIIAEKNKELDLSRLQNEKDLMDMKNAQLQLDYKLKSKELATSTMDVVSTNELLNQIKVELSKIEDKQSLAPVMKIIDRNLGHNQNWKLFKEAFNNADSEFFTRLKEVHPELSPNDLKLCAYLRLNMSSKEIAPLFNISPRSVEIKRYRLRKKMNLENNQNLADYIVSV